MPRYFFNIAIGKQKPIPDPEGDELDTDRAARQHARMVAREMPANRER
jgi:hypothetical protein